MRTWLRFLPLIVLAALAVTALALGLPARLAPERLLADASDFLGLASSRPLITFALLCIFVAVVTAVGLPGAFAVFAAAGFLLGVPAAMLAAAIGNTIGTSLLMLALKHAFFGDDRTPKADQGTLARLRKDFSRHPFAYALALRAMPVLPNGVVTATLAALRCPWPGFLASSALGPQMNAGLMAWMGSELAYEVRAGNPLEFDTLTRPGLWLPMLLVVVLALAPTLIRRRARTEPAAEAVKDECSTLRP
jgi:uncharacterized membrane protein YdjX (TVP38/TMEM64 family)